MKNDPRLDVIAKMYTEQVIGAPQGVVVMDVTAEEPGYAEEHCPHAAQGCRCGGCPECSVVDDQQQEHDPTEIKMALAELKKAREYAGKLEEMLQTAHGLEGWTAAKITKASDYLSSVYHWLEYEAGEGGCDKSQFNMGYEDGEVGYEDGE